MAAWVRTIAARVRAAAPRQLVATGEEGFTGEGSGQCFDADTGAVDVASIHLYPEAWRWPLAGVAEAGARWIREHADAAARRGRPLLVGEFGLRNDGALPLEARRRAYDAWMRAAIEHAAVAGACSWSFSTDDRPDGWDPFTWTLRDGTDEAAAENRYADLHRRWAHGFVESAQAA
jgi:mannan endo-1,4-beta-mannosidase